MNNFEVIKVQIVGGAPALEEIFKGTRKACRNYKKLLDDTLNNEYKRIIVKEDNSIYLCDETEILIITINERTI